MSKIALMAFALSLCSIISLSASEYVSPEFMEFSPDGKLLYVTGATSGRILAVDAESGKVANQIDLSVNPVEFRLLLTELFLLPVGDISVRF